MAKTQRYVILRGQVFRWEEKEPFETSGRSVRGALEYDRVIDKVKCHECGEWFRSMAFHLSQRHQMVTRDYKYRHGLRSNTGLCSPLISEKMRNIARSRKVTGSLKSSTIDAVAARRQSPSQKGRKYNFQEVLNERGHCKAQTVKLLRQLAEELGRAPKYRDDHKLALRVSAHFGSWKAGLSEIHMQPNAPGQPAYSASLLRESVIEFYVLNRRLPRTSDFGRGRLASLATYNKTFGGFARLFRECGLFKVFMGEKRYHPLKNLGARGATEISNLEVA